MQKKLLLIVGPTATSKTRLALSLAHQFGCDIISADSRQVYKNMDVGTGKDIPPGFVFQDNEPGFYTDGKIKIWGYDLVGPRQEFSVSHYLKQVRKIFKHVYADQNLAIIVGGTGLYVKALIQGIETSNVPRNETLRAKLGSMSVQEAFEMLAHLDPLKAASMNASDRKNMRRIARAVEIASFKGKVKKCRSLVADKDLLIVGFKLKRRELYTRIENRVDKRLMSRIEPEIDKLLRSGVSWDDQAMSALGYAQWRGYYEGEKTISEVEESWKMAERRYAKRQLTWFKNVKNIYWFDMKKPSSKKNLENMVKKWYKKTRA